MNMVRILFYVMGLIVLASALFVAASKNLVRSVFMFFVTLMGLAGLYILALADFIAITQIVIYVGGVLVLILFAFMLSGRETLATLQQQNTRIISISKLPAILLAVLFFIVMVNMVLRANPDQMEWIKASVASKNEINPGSVTVNNIGINLMTQYLLPFEAISILLMMALVGAAHLSRKEPGA